MLPRAQLQNNSTTGNLNTAYEQGHVVEHQEPDDLLRQVAARYDAASISFFFFFFHADLFKAFVRFCQSRQVSLWSLQPYATRRGQAEPGTWTTSPSVIGQRRGAVLS